MQLVAINTDKTNVKLLFDFLFDFCKYSCALEQLSHV